MACLMTAPSSCCSSPQSSHQPAVSLWAAIGSSFRSTWARIGALVVLSVLLLLSITLLLAVLL